VQADRWSSTAWVVALLLDIVGCLVLATQIRITPPPREPLVLCVPAGAQGPHL